MRPSRTRPSGCSKETVIRLVTHFARQTGLRRLCIGGGVGLNVKMNSRIRRSGLFDDVFPFPVPNDSGLAIGAAVGHWVDRTRAAPRASATSFPGAESFTDDDIELQLRTCGLSYHRCDDIADATAELLAAGKVVGWFQGRMEGGPRALGGRSILADPRSVEARDRVNAAVKFREYWRPFCPSLTEEAGPDYLEQATSARFMILAFEATEWAKRRVPAVVHVDGTMRRRPSIGIRTRSTTACSKRSIGGPGSRAC